MVILAGLVVALAVLFVLAPLLGWGDDPAFETEDARAAGERDALLHRRQQILAGIKDLELEYAVGKLTREDFDRTREALGAEAVEVYRRLDEDAGA